jgi:hypothetical protein
VVPLCPAALWSLDVVEVLELGVVLWSALVPLVEEPVELCAELPVAWSLDVLAPGVVELVLGEVAPAPAAPAPVALWSVELVELVLLGLVVLWSGGGVVVLLPAELCPVPEGFVVEVGALLGCDGLSVPPVVEFGTVWPMLLPVEVVVLLVLPVAPELVELVSGDVLVLEEGVWDAVEPCVALVLWSFEVVAAPVLPVPTVLDGVWPLTGGVVWPAVLPVVEDWLLVSGEVCEVVVLWVSVEVVWLPALLVEPVEPAVGLFTVAEVPAAPAPTAAPAAPVLLEEDWLVQESEILFTELTWIEPSLAWVPWIETCWPSYCFRLELSPLRLTVWPLSEAKVQLPPDCRRQPVMEFWELALVAPDCPWALVSTCALLPEAASGWVPVGDDVLLEDPALPAELPAPAPAPPPAWAKAMPDASIIAISNFLFMFLLLLRSSPPMTNRPTTTSTSSSIGPMLNTGSA